MHPGFRETKIGRIPNDWEVRKLKELSEIKFSNVDKKSLQGEIQVLLCNYMDVYYNEYVDDKVDFMEATATKNEVGKFSIMKGDVIITKDSEMPDDIAKSAVVIGDLNNVLCGYHLALIRPIPDVIESIFLSKQLLSTPINNQFVRLAQGLTRFGLNVSSIENAVIPVPPIGEQLKITAILSSVDDAIGKTKAIIEETKQLKKGLMQKLFTEGIGHTRFKETKIGRIPYQWKVGLLKDITQKFLNGGTPSTQINEYWNGEIPWITGTDVTETVLVPNRRFITQAGLENSSTNLVPKGSIIVVTRTGVGKISLAGCDIAISQDITGVVLNKKIADNIFYLWYLKSYASKYISIAQGTTIGGILRKDVEKTIVPLPPIEEQRKIAEILYEVDSKIEKEKTTKEELQLLKKGLMQVLLTGKVRVKV